MARLEKVDEIIIHCSATREGKAFTIHNIDKWHRERGWNGCGYHYVIHLDGSVHTGRPSNVVGAHCTGHNTHSIGVCYIGGLDISGNPKDTRTKEQRLAMAELIATLKRDFPGAKVFGHRDFSNKECPCFDAKSEYK